MMKQAVKVEKLEAIANEVAEVLTSHGVFGPKDDKWGFVERRDFVGQISAHAAEGGTDYLELTYQSGVRFLLHTTIVDGDEARIRDMEGYDHPWPNPNINYEKMNRDIQRILDRQ